MAVDYKSGHWYSIVPYKEGKKYKQKWIQLEAKSKAEAHAEDELCKAKFAAGVVDKRSLSKVKFSKLIDEQEHRYEVDIKKGLITEYTVKIYKMWIDKYISSYFENVNLFAINTQKIRNFEDWLLSEKKLNAKTVRKIFVPLRDIIDVGVDWNAIPYNYARNIRFKKQPAKEIRRNIEKNCMSFGDFISFCSWLEPKDSDFYIAALLAGRIGLRRSELAGLTYGNFNIKDKTLQLQSGRLPQGYTSNLKNSYSGETIGIPDILIEKLKLHIKDFELQPKRNYVFLDKAGSPRSVYWFSEMSKKYTAQYFKETKNEDRYITIHGFRHTFASFVVNSGHSILDAKALLRHGDLNSTQIYLHPEADATKRLTQAIDDEITALLNNQ